MQKIIDLDKLVKKIDNLYYTSIEAFYKGRPRNPICKDLDSINEALYIYGKVFIQLGFFIYEDSKFIFDDPYVIEGIKYNENFRKSQISIIISTSENLDDEYYDKYRHVNYRIHKYPVAGYGIFLDNDLNVEYGYVTNDITGNIINTVPVDNTYHDFNDARDGDRIKEHICSLINSADIWKTDDAPIVRKTDEVAIRGGLDQEAVLKFLFKLKTEVLYSKNGKLKELNKEDYLINNPIPLMFGGKLIFKLTDDVGIYAYEKVENSHGVLYVGKYLSDEEEVLFNEEEFLFDEEGKESDEDIYLNIQEFKPKYTSMDDVNLELKDKKINLDKTMARVSMPDFYAGPTVEVECGGIYIHTVYAHKGSVGGEIYEYEIDDDDFVTVGIYSGLGDYDLRLSPQCYTGDEAGDYGIVIDDDGEIGFYENRSGLCGGLREINDLSEPLNAFVVEILMNTLVFEDPLLDKGMMYCPSCGEAYDNGEELCPDCGTKLVTEFEITMLEYKGLL